MADKLKLDISSTVVEKGLDGAKAFLDKLILPAIEETGLLLKDQVASWRLKNQVKILNRAKDICEKGNIKPKAISLKLLCPYLEYASLEEDEYMQDKWANLLTNLVDSEQNIENNIFPYILSQMSKSELLTLKEAYSAKMKLKMECKSALAKDRDDIDKLFEKYYSDYFETYKVYTVDDLDANMALSFFKIRLAGVDENIEVVKLKNYFKEIYYWNKELSDLDISITRIKAFEAENLIRLGILEKTFTGHAENLSSSRDVITALNNLRHLEDLKVIVKSEYSFLITELGELFLDLCINKLEN